MSGRRFLLCLVGVILAGSSLTAEEIRKIIRFSADDVNAADHPGWDPYLGYGRANLEKALVPIKIK